MSYTILYAYFTAVLCIKSYTCWIINDINTKFIDKNDVVFQEMYGRDGAKGYFSDFSLIYPGTKWCGAGNVADGYDDLGSEVEVDRCCRDHDNCPDTDIIKGGETKYNLKNPVFYSRLSCTCDDAFNTCIKAAGTKAAFLIGNIYFNTLQTKCFREDYPVTNCTKWGGWLDLKCEEYSYDTQGEKVYQWFDEKDF